MHLVVRSFDFLHVRARVEVIHSHRRIGWYTGLRRFAATNPTDSPGNRKLSTKWTS